MGLFTGQSLNDAKTCDCTRARVRCGVYVYTYVEGPGGGRGVVRVRMRLCKVCARAAQRMVCALPHNKKMSGTSGKNHFYEMKGDVGINVTS